MRKLVLTILAFGIAGCEINEDSNNEFTCSNSDQKRFVLAASREWYLWNDLLPDNVRRKDYDSPEALLAYLTTFSPDLTPDDGIDTMTLNATEGEDTILLRKNFVAYLTQTGMGTDNRLTFANAVERINYDTSINGRLLVSSGDGDDQFYVDDNSAITTLDAGTGDDWFQIGQVFGSNPNGYTYVVTGETDLRTVANDTQNIDLTSDSDDIELLQTTDPDSVFSVFDTHDLPPLE